MDIDEAFRLYRPLFQESILPSKLLAQLLKQESFLNVKGRCADLTIAENKSPVQAAGKLLTLIEANSDTNKFDRLIAALKDSDYEDLAENLEGLPEIKDVAVLKNWMEQQFKTLKTIPLNRNLLKSLRSKGLLSGAEEREIISIKERQSLSRGVFYMFALVVRRKAGWSDLVIQALRENDMKKHAHALETGDSQGYDDQALSEEMTQTEEAVSMETTSSQRTEASHRTVGSNLDRLSPVGAECDKMDTTNVPPLESADQKVSDKEEIIPKQTSTHFPETDKSETSGATPGSIAFDTVPKQRIAEASKISVKNIDSSTIQTTIPKTLADEVESGPLSREEMRRRRLAKFAGEQMPSDQSSGSLPKMAARCDRTEEEMVASPAENTVPSDVNTVLGSLDLTIDSSLTGAFESRTSQSQVESDYELARSLQEVEDAESALTIQTRDENSTFTPELNNLGGSVAGTSSATLRVPMNIEEPEMGVPELRLRKYQEELARPAKQGTNTVIVAPTGSGKTIVALDIAKDHLDSADIAGESKVGFVVPTVALVEQQKSQFMKFMKRCKIIGISGDSTLTKRASFAMQLEDCHIAVFTPQILVDAIRKQELDTLGVFTLLIFDECHHSMKDHPYNIIMNIYFEEKKRRAWAHLPQIVGLTASVGVGKADSLEKTELHIITLCASLDAEIVTVTENVEELKKYVNNPTENVHEVRSRDYDPFKEEVMQTMVKIEGMIRKAYEGITFEKSQEFQKGIKPPARRDTELYTQWISTIDNLVTELEEDHIQRTFVECIKYLRVYNKALLVNADCRTKDAFQLITKEIPYIVFPPRQDSEDIDERLHELSKDCEKELERYVDMEAARFPNPKLTKLKEILKQEYVENPDLRGIIFCKTRDLTLALQNWITEDKELKVLKPHKLVGTHTPETKGGMTSRNIEDVLTFFKNGEHKVIVATTVAEEGLDIRKCNLVIRYEHVTNEIARTQAKGRGRAENAKYILIGEIDRGAIQKDGINKMRERMMQKALNNIVRLIKDNKEEYRSRLRQQQEKLAIDREMKKIGLSQKKVLNKNNREEDFEMRCKKCNRYACLASDIRKIEGSHHVVIDENFEDMVEVEVYPKPTTYKHFTQKGRLFCKNCSQEWGTQAEYKNSFFNVLNVKGFMYVDSNRRKGKFKKWKDVPFHVPILTMTELTQMFPSAAISEEEMQILEVRR